MTSTSGNTREVLQDVSERFAVGGKLMGHGRPQRLEGAVSAELAPDYWTGLVIRCEEAVLRQRLLGSAASAPTREGDVAVYRDVMPGVDSLVGERGDHVEEFLRIAPGAAREFTYDFQLEFAPCTFRHGECLEVVDAEGLSLLHLGNLVYWRAGDDSPGRAAASSVTLVNDRAARLTVTIPAEEPSGEILLDPSWSRTFRVGKGKYRTIASVYPDLGPGARVEVLPGYYPERLILIDGVDWYLNDGVVIEYSSSTDSLATVTNNYLPVKCSVTGSGVIRRTGRAWVPAMEITNEGCSIAFTCREVASTGGGISIDEAGKFVFRGDINAANYGVWQNSFVFGEFTDVEVYGNVNGGNDYGIFVGGGRMKARANVTSQWNSAIHCGGNSSADFDFSGTAKSYGLYGAEHSGGSFKITDSTLISLRDVDLEGDAISKYGGMGMTLDNCVLWSLHSTAYSIATQGRADTVTILRPCRANKAKDPLITIIGGELIVDPSLPMP